MAPPKQQLKPARSTLPSAAAARTIPLTNTGKYFMTSQYYPGLDSNHKRANFPNLFAPEASIVWNGHIIPGPANLASAMPPSTHKDMTVDVQPCMDRSDTAILTVTGSVTYNPGTPKQDVRKFHHVLILRWDSSPEPSAQRMPGHPKVVSDLFRWTNAL